MTHDSAHDSIEQLDSVLEAERQALLVGDLDQISRLLEVKEALIDTLNTIEPAAQPELQNPICLQAGLP